MFKNLFNRLSRWLFIRRRLDKQERDMHSELQKKYRKSLIEFYGRTDEEENKSNN
jgi:hypothetical protein